MLQLCMSKVASRELRNNTRGLIERMEGGEEVVITVDGRSVARLLPVSARSRWMSRAEFVHRMSGHQADAGLLDELHALAPDTTDALR